MQLPGDTLPTAGCHDGEAGSLAIPRGMAARLLKSGAAQDDTKQGVSLHDVESGVVGDGVGSREHDRLAGGRG